MNQALQQAILQTVHMAAGDPASTLIDDYRRLRGLDPLALYSKDYAFYKDGEGNLQLAAWIENGKFLEFLNDRAISRIPEQTPVLDDKWKSGVVETVRQAVDDPTNTLIDKYRQRCNLEAFPIYTKQFALLKNNGQPPKLAGWISPGLFCLVAWEYARDVPVLPECEQREMRNGLGTSHDNGESQRGLQDGPQVSDPPCNRCNQIGRACQYALSARTGKPYKACVSCHQSKSRCDRPNYYNA